MSVHSSSSVVNGEGSTPKDPFYGKKNNREKKNEKKKSGINKSR